VRAAVIAQREMGWRLGLALIPHPQPFSLREKGVNLPSPLVGEGLGVRASLPSPLVGEGSGVRASLPSPLVGEGSGVRGSPLARKEHQSTNRG